ncbi:hypothetical protein C8R47DRAFT_1081161 [Mycena vitilis]|nr:hypothetical protein C8R47DRAFT_1081161 [Mycena vitilis]
MSEQPSLAKCQDPLRCDREGLTGYEAHTNICHQSLLAYHTRVMGSESGVSAYAPSDTPCRRFSGARLPGTPCDNPATGSISGPLMPGLSECDMLVTLRNILPTRHRGACVERHWDLSNDASRSPTPTPSSPFHDILNLTQQLTPSKSPNTLRRLRRQLQLQANDVQQEHVNLKRRAVDAEHQNDTSRRPRKTRRRGDRARDVDDPDLNAQAVEARIRQAGRSFALQKALFVADDDVFDTKLADDFDFNREFASSQNERQAQIRDILAMLPDTSRLDNFGTRLGYKPGTTDSAPSWPRWAVPILYDRWEGVVDVDHLFRGEMSIMVFVSVVRGPKGAEGLFEGLSKLSQARCLERIHKIKRATPCVISIGSILTIWLFSPDTQLLRVGDETKINYARRHRHYVRRIREGLRDKKTWAINLLKYWDSIVFPNADKAGEHDTMECEEPEDDDDLDDIFDHAPSAGGRTAMSPSREDADMDDDDEQRRDGNRTDQRALSCSLSPPQRLHAASGSSRHAPRAQPGRSSQVMSRTDSLPNRYQSFPTHRPQGQERSVLGNDWNIHDPVVILADGAK